MRRFERQAAPDFWATYERRWLTEAVGKKIDPFHDWQLEGRTLAQHFHARVRPVGEARNCAYCDCRLLEATPETIDHFLPEHVDRAFALIWMNLFPACVCCNSTHKGMQWSCHLVRPDLEPVEGWFDFDEQTGRLEPAPQLDPETRGRVRLTIHVFGLNAGDRCVARRSVLRNLVNAAKAGDEEWVVEAARSGPYRFVAAKFLASRRRAIAAPSAP